MNDHNIVQLYWTRSEQAIRETDRKYGRYCHYIAYSILQNDSDAEEIVNDTYFKAWESIPPARPNPLRGFLGQLCRRLALDRYDRIHAEKRGGGQVTLVLEELSECVAGFEDDPDASIDLTAALNRFLSSLPDRTRNIFVRRYWYLSPIAEIAKEYGMKESGVTVLMLRTRKKLKEYLSKEGFDV